MAIHEWHSRYGGRQWRVTDRGIETRDAGYLRTRGEPATVMGIWEDYGDEILHASYMVDVPVDMVIAMIPIEAVRRNGRFDPRSDRKEPGYISDAKTPHKRSPGLMQTLISTAARMADRYDLFPKEEVTTEFLFESFNSILLGGAYIAHQCKRYGPDPILICGAYNAGSVRKTDNNAWRIMTYHSTRMDRYAAFYNDFHHAVRAGMIELPPDTLLSLHQG